MTKKLPIESQCGNKERHSTRSISHAHKKSLGYTGIDVYHCGHCGFYHIGNSSPRQRDRSYRRQHNDWRVWVSATVE